MSRVELKGLAKRYGPVEAIRRIDLTIEDGEFVVFVGPSGCGKSTLLRLICGLDLPTEGEILFDGKDMRSVPPSRRKLAMVFQSYALYPHLTVADNMGFALRMSGVPKAERAARVAKAAETLQIAALLSRLPKELSGGQRQRVAIGRAIVREPSVFLFDEPLSNLDAELRIEMRAELETMHRRLKATMIFVTHDQIEAMTLADRIVVMHSGVVEQVGSPVELYERPANRFVANFIGSPHMNFLKGRVMARTEHAVVVEVPGVSPQRLTLPLCSGCRRLGRQVGRDRRSSRRIYLRTPGRGDAGCADRIHRICRRRRVLCVRPTIAWDRSRYAILAAESLSERDCAQDSTAGLSCLRRRRPEAVALSLSERRNRRA